MYLFVSRQIYINIYFYLAFITWQYEYTCIFELYTESIGYGKLPYIRGLYIYPNLFKYIQEITKKN